MTTLELYSVFERGLIMFVKDLTRVLKNQGYSIDLNNSKYVDNTDYSISLKTIYSHQYPNDLFVSNQMPEESEAYTFYFPQLDVHSTLPFLLLDFNLQGDGINNPEIEIRVSAHLLHDNKTINLVLDINPYNNLKSSSIELGLGEWKKCLYLLTKYLTETFEKT